MTVQFVKLSGVMNALLRVTLYNALLRVHMERAFQCIMFERALARTT